MPRANELRIIGGQWRRRKLQFCDDPAIRPTPNRIRETLFNWLQHNIQGARCLDAFAGAGALGFEALSRGAQSVVMIEPLRQQQAYLRDNMKLFDANITLLPGEFPSALLNESTPFDLIFLDPPFRAGAVESALQVLLDRVWVHSESLVYYESTHRLDLESMDTCWQCLKSSKAAKVHYGLLRVQQSASPSLFEG